MIPDVIALPLDLAEERLGFAGVKAGIEKTYPAKPAKGNGAWRVVRQNNSKDTVILVVAEEVEGVIPA